MDGVVSEAVVFQKLLLMLYKTHDSVAFLQIIFHSCFGACHDHRLGVHRMSQIDNAKRTRSAGMGMLCFGVGLLVWALVMASHQFAFKRRAIITDGIVQQLHPTVIEFKTASGISHTFRQGMQSKRYPEYVGQSVRVAYLPQDPQRAEIEDFIWTTLLVIVFWSAIFLVFGSFAYLGKLRVHFPNDPSGKGA